MARTDHRTRARLLREVRPSRRNAGSKQSKRRKAQNNDIQWIFAFVILASVLANVSQTRQVLAPLVQEVIDGQAHHFFNAESTVRRRVDVNSEYENAPTEVLANKSIARQQSTSPPSVATDVVTTISSDDSHDVKLWRNSSAIPSWMAEYFEWHYQQRKLLNENNWHEFRFIIMISPRGSKTGGMTDRLRPLPFFLRTAHSTKRIFLIHWGRPAPLEEFLLPPVGGLDWRTPDYMHWNVSDIPPNGIESQLVQRAKMTNVVLQTTTFQSWHYGELNYNSDLEPGEPEAKKVLPHAWDMVFTPSPPVARLIEGQFEQMGVVPGGYASAHIRALYGKDGADQNSVKWLTINAINCASRLRPGGPYFVASDSQYAVEVAKWYGGTKNVSVVSRLHNTTTTDGHPLHIGFYDVNCTHSSKNANNGTAILTPRDFYDTFVDIYLIAGSNCIAHGIGGFGKWGTIMGYNSSCEITHHRGTRWGTECAWVDADASTRSHAKEKPVLKRPLYRTPMPDKRYMTIPSSGENHDASMLTTSSL